jgi:hypothetical protein
MTLANWLHNGWLRPHKTSSKEIADLIQIVLRDLKDAESGVSDDWRFGIAYNAALKLCTILLYAEGYRAEKNLQHYRTIQAVPLILGADRKADVDYLDACRARRNILEYDYIGAVTAQDADELIAFTKEFKKDVMDWLKRNHPDLLL